MGRYNDGKNAKYDFPKPFYEKIIKPYLNKLILTEVEILKPDYIVFFMGPNRNYQDVLDNMFNIPTRLRVDGFDERQLCEIKIPNIKKSFRTYHPRYLFNLKKSNDGKDIDTYFKKIINSIMQDIKDKGERSGARRQISG
jgi:hypothetical protein